MAKSRDKSMETVRKRVLTEKNNNYKRLVFKDSSDEEDNYVIDKRDIKTNKVCQKSKDDKKFSTVPRESSIEQVRENDYKSKLKALYKSESDSDEGSNWRPKDVRKRVYNFDNGNECHSEDKTPPKVAKVAKSVDFSIVKPKATLSTEHQPVEKLPSLSTFVSRKDADSPPQNASKTSSFTRVRENNHRKKLKLELCDSESDSDDANWKEKIFWKSRLSLDNLSEFNHDNTVPPTTIKVEKPVVKQEISFLTEEQPVKKSFLASLSKDVPLKNADPKAVDYRINYTSSREELCKVLYKLFNEKVFDNKLPDDMTIEWNVRLQQAAGKCYGKKRLNAHGTIVSRSVKIGLSTKILDSPDKLRDVLIHEMCHAASWLINKVSNGHGQFWQFWADKALRAFPELPAITRCHNYETKKKFTYKCTKCGYSFERCRISIDINRKRCGLCHGKFKILVKEV